MRQYCKPEAGKYKHNDAEHPIWIFDRRTCSLVCFVFSWKPKRYLTLELLRFSFVLDRIVHLPVPSENLSRRGRQNAETEVLNAWSKIVGDFIAAHSAPVDLREGILCVRVLQPALHYELEQISKTEILRKLKQHFGAKTHP